METIKTSNINYRSVSQHAYAGRYRFLKVPLNNLSSSAITLDPASSQLLEWKLPNVVYNLGKSYLSYNLSIPAQGSTNSGWVANDTLEIAQNISFGTAGGLNLVDVQNVNNYINVARKVDTSTHDYLQSDVTNGLTKADLQTTNYLPVTVRMPASNIFGIPAGTLTTAQTVLEPQYLRNSIALNLALAVKRNFPLKGITGTLFSCPQDQYFADNMYLRIMTATVPKVGFLSTALATPATGSAALTGSVTVANLFLYLAVEKDQMISDSIIQKFNSGALKYQIPYTYTFRYGTVGAGLQSLQVQLNSQYGKLLKRMLVSSFPAVETLNAAFDHSNVSGSKIVSYQTYLDSQPLQDQVLSCILPVAGTNAEMDDFRENKAIIERSGVIMNPLSYSLNWFHCDEFASPSLDPSVADNQIYAGLDLSQPKSWSINMTTTGANYTHYVWAQFLRTVSITAAGPVYE